MEEHKQTEAPRDRAILVGLSSPRLDKRENADEESLEELEALVETAGGVSVGVALQTLPAPNPRTFIGEGKVAEIRELVQAQEASMVIFDNDLSPSQMRVLTEELGVQVLDRSGLILDIFAQRAKTKEGRLQVELAQYQYLLPRLSGMGTSLSRQGGGIGTRGPGETKLETDKRHIRTRISNLSAELKEIEKRRTYARSRRKKDGVLVCAIVGYTNVGKSTLLNLLTDAGVLAENKLFATLETTSRAIELPDGRSLMLVDTVGLIRRLPHHLVEAFKSTLEEAANADVILHICDASAENCEEQAQVTLDLLSELGCDGIPVVTVFNKCDLLPPALAFAPETRNAVLISAKENQGIDQLLDALAKALPDPAKRMRLLLPFSQGGLLNDIRSSGKLFSEEYTPEGVLIEAMVDVRLQKAAAPYETEKA